MESVDSPTLQACLNILRHTPASDAAKNLNGLQKVVASDHNDLQHLLQQVHVPLEIARGSDTNDRPYIICSFNQCDHSHRSPWSNAFHPPIASALNEGLTDKLRNLELHFNEVWDTYRQLYYGKDAIGSVYLKEQDKHSFVGCFLLQKTVKDNDSLQQGQWDSVHVAHVGSTQKGQAQYQIHSTILVTMTPVSDGSHTATNICASLSKETNQSCAVVGDLCHLQNIGKMIEDAEMELRSSMDIVHIPKTRGVVESIRTSPKNPVIPHGVVLNNAILARALQKPSI